MGCARWVWLASLLCLVAALAPAAANAQTHGLAVYGGTPVAIDIPKIGTHARVVPLGDDEAGGMEAPVDPDTVGWYAPGVGVGTPGNALLDGHVDWAGSLRAFGWLKNLAPGDAVSITDGDANVLSYSVDWVRLYAADAAPLDEIFAQTSDETITLITCGGAFDTSARMYVGRWVVRATRTPAALASAR